MSDDATQPWRHVSRVQARIERAKRIKVSGLVYFVACGEYIKIGHSLDHPRERMRAIATLNPYPCDLIGILQAGRDREHAIQQEFAADRHAREWFHATPRLRAYIAEACGEWRHLDRAMRTRTSLTEQIARDLGDAREHWYG